MKEMPDKILLQLIAGNQRFAKGISYRDAQVTASKRLQLAQKGQNPVAAVLTCSDARVPVEMIFDADLGDLFVVRNAGNMVSHSVLASMELAVINFNINLCLVLGHTQCGAIETALGFFRSETAPSDHIRQMITALLPLVEPELHTPSSNLASVREVAARNVKAACRNLVLGSTLIHERVKSSDLSIVGALYDIRTGLVAFDPVVK